MQEYVYGNTDPLCFAKNCFWGNSYVTYQVRLCCAAWRLWVQTQRTQPAWPLSVRLTVSTKVQTKPFNHFAVWSSSTDAVEKEREGNGRLWEKERARVSPCYPNPWIYFVPFWSFAVVYITVVLNFASTKCTCARLHAGELWAWLLCLLKWFQSMQGAWKKHPQGCYCCIEQLKRTQKSWLGLEE